MTRDLLNQVFGQLTVIGRAGSDRFQHAMWLCECSCGKRVNVASGSLVQGLTRSCGCLRSSVLKAQIGPLHPNWKGSKIGELARLRASPKYKAWRKAVFERDHYTCVLCGDSRGGNLNADHIKKFADYPDLRFEISNGRTLCESCHIKTPTFGGRKAA